MSDDIQRATITVYYSTIKRDWVTEKHAWLEGRSVWVSRRTCRLPGTCRAFHAHCRNTATWVTGRVCDVASWSPTVGRSYLLHARTLSSTRSFRSDILSGHSSMNNIVKPLWIRLPWLLIKQSVNITQSISNWAMYRRQKVSWSRSLWTTDPASMNDFPQQHFETHHLIQVNLENIQ